MNRMYYKTGTEAVYDHPDLRGLQVAVRPTMINIYLRSISEQDRKYVATPKTLKSYSLYRVSDTEPTDPAPDANYWVAKTDKGVRHVTDDEVVMLKAYEPERHNVSE